MATQWDGTTLPGYPVEFTFETLEEIDEYFDHDKLICLRCGHAFRGLGMHLHNAHAMGCDEYRRIYGIPWRRGLNGKATFKLHSDISKAYRAEHGTLYTPESQRKATKAKKRRHVPAVIRKAKKTIQRVNEELGNDGSVMDYRRKHQTRRGTEEFHEKMRNRPQCTGENIAHWWVGKKQSPEHIQKRVKSMKRTVVAKKQYKENADG